MIFSIADHVEQIKNGSKTQTRRKSPAYLVGKTYSIQPNARALGIPEGRILITKKREEKYLDGFISVSDAIAEGGYTSGQFESLFQRMCARVEISGRASKVRNLIGSDFFPPAP